MKIEVRNGKKVIVEETVREYIDDIVWQIQNVNRGPHEPYFLVLQIYRMKSLEAGGCAITYVEQRELHDFSPDSLRTFANLCDKLIEEHGAVRRIN